MLFSEFNEEVINSIIHNKGKVISFTAPKGMVLNFRDKGGGKIYFLQKGSLSLQRLTNSIVLYEINSPYVLGVNCLKNDSVQYKLACTSECEIVSVSTADFIESIRSLEAWENLTYYLLDFLSKLEGQLEIGSCRNVYTIVRKCLLDIWNMPQNERMNVSLYTYILSRHEVSRSSLQKIIHELNVGKYISSQRGCLLSINRLPENY